MYNIKHFGNIFDSIFSPFMTLNLHVGPQNLFARKNVTHFLSKNLFSTETFLKRDVKLLLYQFLPTNYKFSGSKTRFSPFNRDPKPN